MKSRYQALWPALCLTFLGVSPRMLFGEVTGKCVTCYVPLIDASGEPDTSSLPDGRSFARPDDIFIPNAAVHGLEYHAPASVAVIPQPDSILPAASVNGVSLARDCHGRWQWVQDGVPILMRQGGNYSPVPDGRKIDDFLNGNLDQLVAALLTPAEAAKIDASLVPFAKSQGAQIQAAGFTSIRLFQAPLVDAPLETSGEIDRFKRIMRQAFALYGIRVNLGDFVGLYDTAHSADETWIRARVQQLGRIYGSEPWVASITLGNENDYYLGNKDYPSIPLSLSAYYGMMDRMAGVLKGMNVQRPIFLGHGRPTAEGYKLLAGLKNFDGVGLNLYGDADVLNTDLTNLKKLNDTRLAAKSPELAFTLDEFGQATDWLVTLNNQTRADAFNKQMDFLDKSPLIASRYVFELTDEAWKVAQEGPGSDRYGILGKSPIDQAFKDHRETFPYACTAPNHGPSHHPPRAR